MAISWSPATLVKYRKTDAAIKYVAAKSELDLADIEDKKAERIDQITAAFGATSGKLGTAAEARERARLHREKAIELVAEADRLEAQP